MAEHEVECRLFGHATPHRLVGRFADHGQAGGGDGLREHRLQDSHLVHRGAVRTHHRRVHPLGDILRQRVVRFRPAHQGTHDGLLRLQAAEVVAPGFRVGLVVEDRGVTWVGDEDGQVGPIGQFAGERGRGIERDQDGPVLELAHELVRDLADGVVRDRQNDDIGLRQRIFGALRAEAQFLESRSADLADLDMRHLIRRTAQIR